MPAGNHVKNNSLDFWLRNQSVSQPTTVFVALYTTNPTAADTGTEVSGGGYARQPAVFSTPSISGDVSVVQNSAAITFPQLAASAGTAAFVGIRDAQTGGNLLFFEALPTAIVLAQGYTPYWAAGELRVTIR
ncbi:MAG: hypothetical protein FWE62_03840 [Firmicutes bacterium]|nr:hypothetical protein [Bacillota bacterium]